MCIIYNIHISFVYVYMKGENQREPFSQKEKRCMTPNYLPADENSLKALRKTFWKPVSYLLPLSFSNCPF